jgi:hypothetical protein
MSKAKVTLFFLWKLKMVQRNGTAGDGLIPLVDHHRIYVLLAVKGMVLRNRMTQLGSIVNKLCTSEHNNTPADILSTFVFSI